MNRKESVIFILIILFTASIRIALIGQKNLWFDEIYSWHISSGSFTQIINDTSADIHPPFYYFLLKLWVLLTGDSVFLLRILSVIFSTITAIIFLFLSLKVTDKLNSFILLVLFSISPLNIFYSQEARMASLNLLLNILSVYCVIKIIETSKIKDIIKEKYAFLFIIFSISAFYTHYFSIPVFIANSLWLLITLRNNKKALITIVITILIIILSFLPWLPVMLSQASRGQQWRSAQNIFMVGKEVINYILDFSMGLYYYNTVRWFLYCITIMVLFIIFTAVYTSLRKHKLLSSNFLFITLIIFVTFSSAIVIAFKQRIEFFRYLSILVPYLLILIFIPLSYIKKKYFITAIIIFTLINFFGLYKYFAADYKNNDYRQLLTEINNNIKEGEKIFVEPHYMGWIVDYYSNHGYDNVPGVINYGWGIKMLADTIATKQPNNFYLILDYSSLDTNNYKTTVNKLKNSYKLSYFQSFILIPREVELYRFEK